MIDKYLALDTPEAAVRSCVELMAMLFEQPTEKTAYYLDLYYQVRRVYEEQRQRNEDAARFLEQFTRPYEPEPNVYPEPRRTMNEPTAAKVEEEDSSSREDGPPRASAPTEKTAAVPGAEQAREEKFEEIIASVNAGAGGPIRGSAPTETPSVTSVRTGDSSPSGGAKKGGTPGEEKTEKAGGEETEKAREEKFRDVLDSVNAGTVRASQAYKIGNHHAAEAAAEKRRIRERLVNLRALGVSTPQIIRAANGKITHDQIHDILQATAVPIAVYRALDAALELLERDGLPHQ